MNKLILLFIDYFFLFFHIAIILINVFGWIFKRTRKLQAITLLVTLASWFILGFFYGWGYCILTDWHWDVLRALENPPAESSYIQYLFNRVLNTSISKSLADHLAIWGLVFGVAGAIFKVLKKATAKI